MLTKYNGGENMSKSISTLITAMAAFSAGVITGLLVTPRSGEENRKWISEHSGEAKNWVGEKGEKLLEEGEKRLSKISQGIKETIPDLYKATESIHFDEEDLESA